MAYNGELCFYLRPGNECNIHKDHSRPTQVSITILTHHMNYYTYSFETIILSSKITHTGAQAIV